MGWYYYLADNLGFPFTGQCTRERVHVTAESGAGSQRSKDGS